MIILRRRFNVRFDNIKNVKLNQLICCWIKKKMSSHNTNEKIGKREINFVFILYNSIFARMSKSVVVMGLLEIDVKYD